MDGMPLSSLCSKDDVQLLFCWLDGQNEADLPFYIDMTTSHFTSFQFFLTY